MAPPKTFISYAWSSPEHERWVVDLATEMRSSGVDVILDKWDLREGNDAISFMERMVTDPEVSKVVMIFDRIYVEKSDGKKGGVGTEAQIISPRVYGSQDQTKFAAVVRELDADGIPYAPTFFKSRIHIDMTDDTLFSERFEQLLRWIFDKPVWQKPPLGPAPAFLVAEVPHVPAPSAALHRRATEGIIAGKANYSVLVADYFEQMATAIEARTVNSKADPFDEVVVEDINAFVPVRNEYVSLVSTLTRHIEGPALSDCLHRALEPLVPLVFRPQGLEGPHHTWDWDNKKYIVLELFLYTVALLIKNERYSELSALLGKQFYFERSREYGEPKMVDFAVFREPVESLDFRAKRLVDSQGRSRTSIQADMLKENCVGLPVSFTQLMQADFTLYIRSAVSDLRWWPVTLVYASRSGAFEVYARSASKAYFERFKSVLGVETADGLRKSISQLVESRGLPSYGWHSLGIAELSGSKDIATRS